MKKTNIILILIAMLSLLGLGAVVLLFGDNQKTPDTGIPTLDQYKDNYIEDANRNKEIVVEVKENFAEAESGIYTNEFQTTVRSKINDLIKVHTYTEDNPLVIYNPFLTNS